MNIEVFFDPETYTLTYLVFDPATKDAVIIDPVYNLDYASGTLSPEQVTKLTAYLNDHDLNLHYVLETHAHADHVTASALLKEQTGARVAISYRISEVQKRFKNVFNMQGLSTDGSQFDKLIDDNESWNAGSLTLKALPTPGHTPACISIVVNDSSVFTGDTLFMPDYGVGRCDFPGGNAKQLYRSITNEIYTLPSDVTTYVGHDYLPQGRELQYSATIQEQKDGNIQLSHKTTERDFVRMREARDSTLSYPRLIMPSLQININAGQLPKPENNGRAYLKIPLNS